MAVPGLGLGTTLFIIAVLFTVRDLTMRRSDTVADDSADDDTDRYVDEDDEQPHTIRQGTYFW